MYIINTVVTGDGRQHGDGRRDQLGGHQAEAEAGLHILVMNNNVLISIYLNTETAVIQQHLGRNVKIGVLLTPSENMSVIHSSRIKVMDLCCND